MLPGIHQQRRREQARVRCEEERKRMFAITALGKVAQRRDRRLAYDTLNLSEYMDVGLSLLFRRKPAKELFFDVCGA